MSASTVARPTVSAYFIVGESTRRDAGAFALGVDDGRDLRVVRATARTFGVQIETTAGLLAEPAAFAKSIGDLYVACIGIACGRAPLARGPANVAACQID